MTRACAAGRWPYCSAGLPTSATWSGRLWLPTATMAPHRRCGPRDLDDLRLLVEPELDRKGIVLGWRNDVDGALLVHTGRIRQAVLNLLLNASKAVVPGGAIRVHAFLEGALFVVDVLDDGPGMPPQEVDRLVGSGPAESPPLGHGLGLWIVRRLVSGSGGRASVDRMDGLMTRVRTEWPILAHGDGGRGMTADARHAGRLAVVEDDPSMGESLVQGLELAGWRTDWYRTAASALAGIASTRPDLVICDVRLPDVPGDELYRRLNDGTAPPFIFMTAFGAIDQAIGLVRAGAEDYLAKPFDMDVLFEKVRAVLGRRLPAMGGGALGGCPAAMREVEALLARLATRAMPVLLVGETGTGKEVCARFPARGVQGGPASPSWRSIARAIPAELLESEVFGHERGAVLGCPPAPSRLCRAGAQGHAVPGRGRRDCRSSCKPRCCGSSRSGHSTGSAARLRCTLQARLVCATNRDLAGRGAPWPLPRGPILPDQRGCKSTFPP